MAQNFEEIVRDWYIRLRPAFLAKLSAKYSSMTFSEAEDIYQDVFEAIHQNLTAGRVSENTNWTSYIITVGLYMASKRFRNESKNVSLESMKGYSSIGVALRERVSGLLDNLSDADAPLSENVEVHSLLGNELSHIPEPCASVIRLYYYDNMSMREIAEEIGYKNADTAKVMKNRCMGDLIRRVSTALHNAGFDVTPKKSRHNG